MKLLHPTMSLAACPRFCATLSLLLPLGIAAQEATAPTPQRVEVIGTSPLPGQGVDRDALPYNTQVIRRSSIDAAQADNMTDLITRRMTGVQVNDIQGSPFQGDLTFRGFRASGILGAAQGLSVYLDGVRINEPFGDIVQWDMVPEFALRSIALIPGANPAFGLNTLGGALALTSADAASAPGWRSEASFGSFGRKRLDLSHGAQHADGWSHYIGAGLFDETGWRDYSAGRLGTAMGKVIHQGTLGDFTLNVLLGRSRLAGNYLVPLYGLDDAGTRTPELGELRRGTVYTHPDITRNRLTHVSGHWKQQLDSATLL